MVSVVSSVSVILVSGNLLSFFLKVFKGIFHLWRPKTFNFSTAPPPIPGILREKITDVGL
jgi:hypothetical protein